MRHLNIGLRSSLFLAVAVAAYASGLMRTDSARAAVVGLLDGVSDRSTFGTSGTTDISTIGWIDVNNTARTWTSAAGPNVALIHRTGDKAAYEARYDTGVLLQPNTEYNLIVDLGFNGSSSSGSTATSSVQLGTFSGSAFSSMVVESKTVRSIGTVTPGYGMDMDAFSDRAHLTFTTGSSVPADSTLGVSLARVSGSNTGNWFGFDNVVLWATPSTYSYVGGLDGTSVQSRFYTGTGAVDTTTLPDGWHTVSGSTRVWGNDSNGYGVIHANATRADFSIVYDTGEAILPNYYYLLSTDLGFQTPGGTGQFAGNFEIEIGTWDGFEFASLAADSGTVNYRAFGFGDNKSGSTALALGTDYSVTGENLAVRLTRLPGGTVNWQGFDNVVLKAAPIPEPGTWLLALSALTCGLLVRRRR